jgi:peptide/nickel transport system substrate-binding protein
VFLIVPTQDAEVLRFQAGDIDVIDNLSAENFALLEKDQLAKHYRVFDSGPGFEYDFLFFNLNDLGSKKLPEIQRKQEWFRHDEFRQAISAAIDREAIVRLVYQKRAIPLWGQVTPANKLWIDTNLPHPPQSFSRAMALLRSAGFSSKDGQLVDAHGAPIEFSILVNATNARQMKIATIIQDDLKHLGMRVHVVPLEFGSLWARVNDSFDYEASVFGLVSPDADPNPEINVWTSSGGTHLWAFAETHPMTTWQTELDRLMLEQTTILDYKKRKQVYDRVQEIIAQHDPVICLVNPDILVGAKDSVEGIKPVVMQHHLLWNAEQIFRDKQQATKAD